MENEILLIRFVATKKNVIAALCHMGNRIVITTSSIPMQLSAGVYLSPENDFTSIDWFLNHDLRIEKRQQIYLERILTNFVITKVIVI